MPDPGSKARASGDTARSRFLHRGIPPGFDLKPWRRVRPAPQSPALIQRPREGDKEGVDPGAVAHYHRHLTAARLTAQIPRWPPG